MRTKSGRRLMQLLTLTVPLVAVSSATGQNICANPIRNTICQFGICDGTGDPATVTDERTLITVPLGSRRIALHTSEKYQMGWASIENARPGDEVWLDRFYGEKDADNRLCWEERRAIASVPPDLDGWRTMMIFYAPGTVQLRACGKRGDADGIACTPWLPVCDSGGCDGKDPAGAHEYAVNPQASRGTRKVVLHISEQLGMAWASIENGGAGDQVWIDRQWDGQGQNQWDGLLGLSTTPPGRSGWRTWMFHFNDVPHGGFAKLRACGRASNSEDYICTQWLRPYEWHGAGPRRPANRNRTHRDAVDGLVRLYRTDRGNWFHDKAEQWWWQTPNTLTALAEYMIRTNDRRHVWIVDRTFHKNIGQLKPDHYKHFTNVFIDDTGWWGLAWIRAYDLTRDPRYLDAARTIADFMWQKGNDEAVCCGGVWWQAEPRPSWPDPYTTPGMRQAKNAITSELFMKLAASIYNRSPSDVMYRDEAERVWTWFETNPMMRNPSGLVWDALYEAGERSCTPRTIWSYSQGVILGAIAEMHRATTNSQLRQRLLESGRRVANAAITANPQRAPAERLVYAPRAVQSPLFGVLREECEEGFDHCGQMNKEDGEFNQGVTFKGVFMRNLREFYDLDRSLGQTPLVAKMRAFLVRQRATLLDGHASSPQFGFYWVLPEAGLWNLMSFGTQATAIDALNAGLDL
jgi:predicted alpha-1,6-mannanase (GH76 family)